MQDRGPVSLCLEAQIPQEIRDAQPEEVGVSSRM
jgi:hypothetical protein